LTTAVEIKRWTKPLLRQRSDLALHERSIYVRPVRHIIYSVFFPGSSDKTDPRTRSYFSVPFSPSLMIRALWAVSLPVGHSTDEGFQEKLARLITERVDQDRKFMSTIEAFYQMTLDDRWTEPMTGYWELAKYPYFHAPVLAALGRLSEACEVVDRFVTASEPKLLAKLKRGEDQLAKRRNSWLGKFDIEQATEDLRVLSELQRLADLATAGDRAGVGALLREWEEKTIRRFGLEFLWQPAPFPVELGEGD
jgi:hypothetical protein